MLSAPSISLCSTAGGLVQHLSFMRGQPNPRPTWLVSVTFTTLLAPTTFGPFLALTAFLAFALPSAFTPCPIFTACPIELMALTSGGRMATVLTFTLLCLARSPLEASWGSGCRGVLARLRCYPSSGDDCHLDNIWSRCYWHWQSKSLMLAKGNGIGAISCTGTCPCALASLA